MTAPLSVSQLFTPLPSGVGPNGQVPTNPAAGTWLGQMLTVAAAVQLPTTSWQPGAPERTILAIQAVTFAQQDVQISLMAQGGFLQSAASGSVTFTLLNGTTVTTPVTPDPSNAAQNPTGALGWEDALANNVYDVFRLQPTAASGPLAFVNLGVSTVGPYAESSYHAGNPTTGATYSNPASLTIPPSAIAGTGGQVAGVTPGQTYTLISTTSAHGLTAGLTVFLQLPPSTGINIFTGNSVPGSGFALVVSATSTTFTVQVGSAGTWTAGGTVYLCTVQTMTADATGIGSNAGPGQVTTTITQNANVFVSNVVAWSGTNWESNASLQSRCILSLANRSPNGPSQSYVYYAETAAQLLAAEATPYTLTNGPVLAVEFASPGTGIVTTVVASSTPASSVLGGNVTPGVSQDPVTGVSNTNPCVIACANVTSLKPGQSMTVTVSGVLGVSGVNGTFVGTYVTSNQFSIPIDTTSAGSYAGGGSVEGGDLGAIDALLQQNVVPDQTVAITASARALPVSIVATVVVPQVYAQAYALAVQVQLAAQIAAYPIGGFVVNGTPQPIFYDDIVGAFEEAGVLALGQASYVRQVQALSVTANSQTITQSGQSIVFPSNEYQAVLGTPTITVLST